MNPCLKCGAPATSRFTVDLDIAGLLTCETCASDVRMVTMLLCSPNPTSQAAALALTRQWTREQKELTQ